MRRVVTKLCYGMKRSCHNFKTMDGHVTWNIFKGQQNTIDDKSTPPIEPRSHTLFTIYEYIN
jgi:hypothetical protein